MFKGRFGVWISIIVIAILANWLIGAIPGWLENNELMITVDVENDNDMSQVLDNVKINKIIPIATNENPDLIISDKELQDTNLTKYENVLYSPLVMYARYLRSYPSGFILAPSSSQCYKVDLYNMLIAMEQGSEFESLGIDKSVASGVVTIHIPNETSPYYDEVVELFYLTLNGGNTPTSAERESLAERVNGILKKCTIESDIGQAIKDSYDSKTKSGEIFIGPEYLFTRGGAACGNGYNSPSQYQMVYFLNTVYIQSHIYIVTESPNVEIANKFIANAKKHEDFMASTGWRIKNSTFNVNQNVNYVYYKNP